MCKQEKRVSGISDGLFNVVVNLCVPRQQPISLKVE
jgi:hypothetical protein